MDSVDDERNVRVFSSEEMKCNKERNELAIFTWLLEENQLID
jgi:hypothetical protein